MRKEVTTETHITPRPWKCRVSSDGYHITGEMRGQWTNVATVHGMRPDDARLITLAPDLLALAHKYASECGDCAGTRIVPDGRGGDEPCTECQDIWAVIDEAEGRKS